MVALTMVTGIDKKALRSLLKNRIQRLSTAKKLEESLSITNTLFSLPQWEKSTTVLIFYSMEEEVRTQGIITRAGNAGKKIAFPRMQGKDIVFHYVSKNSEDSLKMHPYGVREPEATSPECIPSQKNTALLITPGLGFTPKGLRLGRGKGFYDRYISQYRDFLDIVGIAFNCQIVNTIPVEPHDQPIPIILTPSKIYHSN